MNAKVEQEIEGLTDHCSVCGSERKSAGNMSEDDMLAAGYTRPMIEAAKRQSDAILSRMSPRGSLGLPELLDNRRLQYGIVDEIFSVAAIFDRVYVFQLPMKHQMGAKYEGTDLFKAEVVRGRELKEAPRGVLVSAGAPALDKLRSNGVALGHIVTIIHMAPWRMELAQVEGKDFQVLMLRTGDITGSEDLRYNLMKGNVRYEWDETDGQHKLVDQSGQQWNPEDPELPFDY